MSPIIQILALIVIVSFLVYIYLLKDNDSEPTTNTPGSSPGNTPGYTPSNTSAPDPSFDERVDALNPIRINHTAVPYYTTIPTSSATVNPSNTQNIFESFSNVTSKKEKIKKIFENHNGLDSERMYFMREFNDNIKDIVPFFINDEILNEILDDLPNYKIVEECQPTPSAKCNTLNNKKINIVPFPAGSSNESKLDLLFNSNQGIDENLKFEYNLEGLKTIKEKLLQKSDKIFCGTNKQIFKDIKKYPSKGINEFKKPNIANDSRADTKIEESIIMDALIEKSKTLAQPDTGQEQLLLAINEGDTNISSKFFFTKKPLTAFLSTAREPLTGILSLDSSDTFTIEDVLEEEENENSEDLNYIKKEKRKEKNNISIIAKILSDSEKPGKSFCVDESGETFGMASLTMTMS